MARISPNCKQCKIFISALKSPTYRDFMIKKSLESKRSKSHTWAPLRNKMAPQIRMWIIFGPVPKSPNQKRMYGKSRDRKSHTWPALSKKVQRSVAPFNIGQNGRIHNFSSNNYYSIFSWSTMLLFWDCSSGSTAMQILFLGYVVNSNFYAPEAHIMYLTVSS
jgi:hypothetical protein